MPSQPAQSQLRRGGYVKLPALPKPPAAEMAGPTPWCNWVIPGQVLAGAYPASIDDGETERLLTSLLEVGIDTFVCLQAEVNLNVPEATWRAGKGLRPYIRDAQRLLSRVREGGSTDRGTAKITQQKVDFLHLPILDGHVTADCAMHRLAEDVCERVLRGERLYIHCWGGHGRTGTLVAIMLGRLYSLPLITALRYTQAYHDSRGNPQGVKSPQTPIQRAQVRRLLSLPSSTPSTPLGSVVAVEASSAVAYSLKEGGQQPLKQPGLGSPGNGACTPDKLQRSLLAGSQQHTGSKLMPSPLLSTRGVQQVKAVSATLEKGTSIDSANKKADLMTASLSRLSLQKLTVPQPKAGALAFLFPTIAKVTTPKASVNLQNQGPITNEVDVH